MENVVDSSNVIMLRRLGFFQIIKRKLEKDNIMFDEEKLLHIIKNLDNLSFLTAIEKQNKKIDPMITADKISRDNPSMLNIIIEKLREN